MSLPLDPGRGTDVSAEALRQTGLYRRLLQMASTCRKHPAQRGVLSTGEQVTVALILNRPDWLKDSTWTILEAVARCGPEWLPVAVLVHRDGWNWSTKRWEVP